MYHINTDKLHSYKQFSYKNKVAYKYITTNIHTLKAEYCYCSRDFINLYLNYSEYIKNILAQKLVEQLIEKDLISYDIKQQNDYMHVMAQLEVTK